MTITIPTIKTPAIPAPSSETFTQGISHPDLWLWDSWCYTDGPRLNLYSLALSKISMDGKDIHHSDRNDYTFHIRSFQSEDKGETWTDQGSVLTPSQDPTSFYGRNVWSGSVEKLKDGRVIMGFTGIREVDAEHTFVQSIGIATSSDGHQMDNVQAHPISCPVRDYDEITQKGYYLGPRDQLGNLNGEEGGPILAWRDPYFVITADEVIHCFWSGKVSPTEGAVVHCTLKETDQGFEIDEFYPPQRLPDGDKITQAEVPKIYQDQEGDDYYLLISACNRINETQDDSDVSKSLHLYISKNLQGPWFNYKDDGAKLASLDYMFGASITEHDFEKGEFSLVAPITEMSTDIDAQLTFAPLQRIQLT